MSKDTISPLTRKSVVIDKLYQGFWLEIGDLVTNVTSSPLPLDKVVYIPGMKCGFPVKPLKMADKAIAIEMLTFLESTRLNARNTRFTEFISTIALSYIEKDSLKAQRRDDACASMAQRNNSVLVQWCYGAYTEGELG